jgi:hypothetical protein
LGVLVFGFAAILAWLEFHGRFVVQAIVLMVLLAGTAMVVKTIMLSLLAWYIASTSGGSFGNPLTTILKIAGLIVGLDAATLWTWTAMVAVGAITPSGQFYIGKTLLVLFLVTLVAAAIVAQLLYGLHGDEANLFSRFIAGGNLVMNVLLLVGLVVVVHALANAVLHAKAVAANSIPTSANQPQTASSASAANITTDADRQIASRIGRGDPSILEGRDWEMSILFGKKEKPLGALIDQMYIAGAMKVYVDTFGDGRTDPTAGPAKIYVELPSSTEQRAACFDLAGEFQDQNRNVIAPVTTPKSARFLEMDMHP